MKQVVLSRSWGLSVADAERIAVVSGVRGVRFAPVIARGSGPRIAAARRTDQRGARFLLADRWEGGRG